MESRQPLKSQSRLPIRLGHGPRNELELREAYQDAQATFKNSGHGSRLFTPREAGSYSMGHLLVQTH